MPDGRKRILSPWKKAWNKTREKYAGKNKVKFS